MTHEKEIPFLDLPEALRNRDHIKAIVDILGRDFSRLFAVVEMSDDGNIVEVLSIRAKTPIQKQPASSP